jgi:hypothetical protein
LLIHKCLGSSLSLLANNKVLHSCFSVWFRFHWRLTGSSTSTAFCSRSIQDGLPLNILLTMCSTNWFSDCLKSREIILTASPSHQGSNGETVETVVWWFRSIPFSLGVPLFDSTLTVVCSDDAMHLHYAILMSSDGTTSTVVVIHLSVGQNEKRQ